VRLWSLWRRYRPADIAGWRGERAEDGGGFRCGDCADAGVALLGWDAVRQGKQADGNGRHREAYEGCVRVNGRAVRNSAGETIERHRRRGLDEGFDERVSPSVPKMCDGCCARLA